MAALTKERNTQCKTRGRSISMKMKGTTKIFAGAMVAADATGFAVPAGNTVGHTVIGRAEQTVDNLLGADGALSIRVNKGTHHYNNGGTVVTQADIGKSVNVVDDNTVAKTTTNTISAGILDEIDADGGCWVASNNGQ